MHEIIEDFETLIDVRIRNTHVLITYQDMGEFTIFIFEISLPNPFVYPLLGFHRYSTA